MTIHQPPEFRNRQILRFVDQFARQNRFAPSYRQIGLAVGLSSSSSVRHQIKRMENAGLITTAGPHTNRTIALTAEGRKLLRKEPSHGSEQEGQIDPGREEDA